MHELQWQWLVELQIWQHLHRQRQRTAGPRMACKVHLPQPKSFHPHPVHPPLHPQCPAHRQLQRHQGRQQGGTNGERSEPHLAHGDACPVAQLPTQGKWIAPQKQAARVCPKSCCTLAQGIGYFDTGPTHKLPSRCNVSLAPSATEQLRANLSSRTNAMECVLQAGLAALTGSRKAGTHIRDGAPNFSSQLESFCPFYLRLLLRQLQTMVAVSFQVIVAFSLLPFFHPIFACVGCNWYRVPFAWDTCN